MTYQPASYFLTQIGGTVGALIAFGEWAAQSPSRYSHCGIILDADGTILEAEPGGARIAHISEYEGRPLLVSDAPVQAFIADRME